MSPRSRASAAGGALAVMLALGALRAIAQDAGADAGTPPPPPPLLLRYTFQPDCLRKSADPAKCDVPKTSKRLDLGPQIAVWIEKADGSYVDTLMVTNAVAVRGIGNRPGYWRFPSGWHFPYGKRKMALPVWAHARGHTYQTLVIQDDDGSGREGGGELALGFHESVSSPDPYYCLSFMPATWVFGPNQPDDVDAITCPTGMFNSAKGRFDKTLPPSYYPPRNDLPSVGPHDCDYPTSDVCPSTSAASFPAVNDLDAVAAATPPYGAPYTGSWMIPADLPEGPYMLAVEVNKEFDNNAAHMHPAFQDQALPDNGLLDNFGQPSVVWKVPFQLDRSKPQQAAAMEIAGAGDWDGATGTLNPPGNDISDLPGSGRGRLLVIARPAVGGGTPIMGRVHVTTELPLTPAECAGAAPDDGRISALTIPRGGITDRDAHIQFTEPADRGKAVAEYEIRYLVGSEMTLATFLQATPAPSLVPQMPGGTATVHLTELKANLTYTLGVRVRGGCVKEGPLVTLTFTTKPPSFKQLHGCFIATAAYGSALEPQVEAIRRLRDRARDNAFAAVAIGLYERASPPVASVLRESETGRALVRAALSPIAALAADADALLPRR